MSAAATESASLAALRRRRVGAFVGRARELEALAARGAAGERLVTLLGPAGIGKTRLACEHALRVLATGAATDVIFCDLTEACDAHGVARAVAEAFSSTTHVAASPD